MSAVIVYYFELLIAVGLVALTIYTIKRRGVGWVPACICGVLILIMVLQRIKTGGVFNVTYFAGLIISMCVIYLLIDLVRRKVFAKK